MKNLYLLLLVPFIVLISCSEDDNCEQTVTYTKGTPIYGQLAHLRVDNINQPPRILESPVKIYLSGEIMLIGEKNKGIHVVDNSDPVNPVFSSFLDIPGNREMAIEGERLFVDAYYDMIEIDISDANNARIVQRIEEAYPVTHTNALGEALIDFELNVVTEVLSCSVNIHNDETVWIDHLGARIPESAVPTSFVSSGPAFGTVNRFAVAKDQLYTIGHRSLNIFDIGEGFSRVRNIDYLEEAMETIYPYDDKLFIGAQNNMSVYTLTDPTMPERIGSFWHATSCDPVLPVSATIAYVTLRSGDDCPGDQNSVNVISYGQINNSIAIQSIEMDAPFAMARIDDRLFVGEGELGFRIFEIASDWSLSKVEQRTDIAAYDIIPHPTDRDVLLFAGPNGIRQYQVGDQNYNLLSSIIF